jgi:aryl-alcohol dehydrogenase-like predicted oxidoreductase
MRGFGRALDADVIGAAGVSNHSLSQWQAAEAAIGHPVTANQVLLNLLHRKPLDDLVPWAARHSLVLKADIRPGVTGALTAKVEAVERYLQA